MLDVVLYGHDRRGRLRLRERSFHSLRGLGHFFSSIESIPWEWAEVTRIGRDGTPQVTRYQAEVLRTMVVVPAPNPCPN